MTEAKHTPGPWFAEEDEEGNWRVADEDGAWVARSLSWAREEEADAYLIAAAPDLLEALERMVSLFLRQNAHDVAGARAAIAKAKGLKA